MNHLRRHAFVLALLVSSCAAGLPREEPQRAPREAKAPSEAREPATDEAENLDPKNAVARADQIYRDQLAVQGRDERFATDRQVAELRRAIALYRQFLERAEGDPQFSDAVKRSRERIEDAERTITFLLGESGEDAGER
jgi:hypothetical protein